MVDIASSERPSAWPVVLMGLVGAGVLGVLWGGEFITLVFATVQMAGEGVGGTWLLTGVQAAVGVGLAVVLGVLAWWSREPWARATYAVWAVLAVALAWAAPTHLLTGGSALPFLWPYLAGLCGLLAAFVGWRGATRSVWRAWPMLAAGLAAALWLMVPAARGALGSVWDTVWQMALAVCAGLAWAVLLVGWAWPAAPVSGWGRGLWVSWLALVGAALLAGVVGVGSQRWLVFANLPGVLLSAAWLALALDGRGALAPVTLWVGSGLAAVVLFFDPAELNLLYLPETVGLAGQTVLGWVVATLALMASVAGSAWALVRWPQVRPWLRGGVGVAAGLMGTALVMVYWVAGQPGWHGDRLFVILRDQANVSAAATLPNRTDRAAFVYRTLTAHAQQTQAPLRQLLNTLGVPYTPYYLVNALDVPDDPLMRLLLAWHPSVDRVLPAPFIRPMPELPAVSLGTEPAPTAPEWNITQIGADRVWRELGVTGAGIRVGQSDSGVDGNHPALQAGFTGQWFDPWFGTTTPTDWGGHGTHTLGTLLGRNGLGVAPEAQWLGCVNLGRNLGNPALYLDCMQFMLAPFPLGGDPFSAGDPTLAAHVLNNSWGCPFDLEGCDATVFLPAVRALRAAGLFVVVSAGNAGPACSSANTPPALYAEVFSVGAINQFGTVADFSSRGPITADGSGRPKPDLLAPGVEVLSAYPKSSYSYASGTSMAGPHVAGVVALMWSANPRLIGDVDRTEQILRATATPYTGALADPCGNPLNVVGVGTVNALEAVQAALNER